MDTGHACASYVIFQDLVFSWNVEKGGSGFSIETTQRSGTRVQCTSVKSYWILLSLAMLRRDILLLFAILRRNILFSLAMLRREIPHPTDQHHPTRQSGREASIEMQTWEDREDHWQLKSHKSLAKKAFKGMLKVLAYRNIDAKADESVIGVRLQRPPGKRVTPCRPCVQAPMW